MNQAFDLGGSASSFLGVIFSVNRGGKTKLPSRSRRATGKPATKLVGKISVGKTFVFLGVLVNGSSLTVWV